ncbi:CvpA family protein [Salinicoccus sp. HZC-1]|uniref:CvpA family protein n=1 Tax=Salinicoccus sp. HZC-1 TaxID=3385497 RepID=UPI00398B0BE1
MSILIFMLLIIGMVIGYRRGIILQLLHLVGTISAIIISAMNYETLSSKFDMVMPYPSTAQSMNHPLLTGLSNTEYAFYDMTAFLIIFVITKVLIQVIVSAFDYLQQISVFGNAGEIIGSVLGLIEMIYVLTVILFMMALVPFEFIQTAIGESGLATFIMEHTFILSDKFIEWL